MTWKIIPDVLVGVSQTKELEKKASVTESIVYNGIKAGEDLMVLEELRKVQCD